MNVSDIHEHFRTCGTWVTWDKTADRVTAGDPSRPVRKVAVCWKASWEALRQAVDGGADLFISHESICVNAVSQAIEPESTFALESEKAKFQWLEQSGLVVYRCHDFWDAYPGGTGIRDSWRDGLQLGGKIEVDSFPFYVTRIEPISLGELAQHILKQVRPLGQNGLLMSGAEDRMVCGLDRHRCGD
jgi:putative NIF3 family GTP cyclohydrolase 1 type 2